MPILLLLKLRMIMFPSCSPLLLLLLLLLLLFLILIPDLLLQNNAVYTRLEQRAHGGGLALEEAEAVQR